MTLNVKLSFPYWAMKEKNPFIAHFHLIYLVYNIVCDTPGITEADLF